MRDLRVHDLYLLYCQRTTFKPKRERRTYLAYHEGYEQFKICCFVIEGNGRRVRASFSCAPSMPGILGCTKFLSGEVTYVNLEQRKIRL